MSSINKPGFSSTGSPRGISFERIDGEFKLVVFGADGKKQHLSALISNDDARAIAEFILSQPNSDEGDE